MKYIYTLIALFACAGSLSAQETVPSVSTEIPKQVIIQAQHFGYLSYNDVLHAMPEYQQAMKSLEELKNTYDQEMTRAEQDFSKKFAEYIDGQKSFPENIMLKRQKELQQLMEQSMQFKKEAQELLTQAEAELMAPLHNKLKDAISAVGKSRNYAYVLNTDANAYPYISGEGEAENCTDAVLTQLGIK
ncbi:MAG: OmpH family outer membrane protein [Bacteroidaceae bacterium]|nr:OmpH family outer membrane protein [Bacteroidaceae bacterium]